MAQFQLPAKTDDLLYLPVRKGTPPKKSQVRGDVRRLDQHGAGGLGGLVTWTRKRYHRGIKVRWFLEPCVLAHAEKWRTRQKQ